MSSPIDRYLIVLYTESFYSKSFRAGCAIVCLGCGTLRSRALRIDARARATVKSARANLDICSVSLSRLTYLFRRYTGRRPYSARSVARVLENISKSLRTFALSIFS